jgi:hypothetical protein
LTSATPRISLTRGAITGAGKHCHWRCSKGEFDAENLVGCDGVLAWLACGVRLAAIKSGLRSLREVDLRRGKAGHFVGNCGDHQWEGD